MNEAQPLPEADRVTLEGLDTVFAESHEPHDVSFENEHGESADGQSQPESLTVFEAARLLDKDVKAVLSMIRRGKLCATKDKNSREWVVDGQCVRGHLGESSAEVVKHSEQETVEPHPMWDIGAEGFRALLEKLDISQQMLRDAHYKIGFLESEVSGYSEKLRLLPDLQSQASRVSKAEQEADELRIRLAEVNAELLRYKESGWSRFCAWLMGSR